MCGLLNWLLVGGQRLNRRRYDVLNEFDVKCKPYDHYFIDQDNSDLKICIYCGDEL